MCNAGSIPDNNNCAKRHLMVNNREVLLVDDSQMITNAFELQFNLWHPDITLTVFNSPHAALAYLQEKDQPPGAMIVDYNMPGMTGAELIAQASEHFSDKMPPNFLYTSNPIAATETMGEQGLNELSPPTHIYEKDKYAKLIDVVAQIINSTT